MTAERYRNIRRVLSARQTTLTVLMENVHKSHNYAAVLRSCDAAGVAEAHAVSTDLLVEQHPVTSASAHKWVDVQVHSDIEAAAAVLHGRGFELLAAHFAPDAVDYREVDYTRPVAILLGAERDGVSPRGAALADRCIVIPMEGMVRSLNVSVACAVLLFEAQRQRRAAGLYDRRHLSDERFSRLCFEWTHPAIADYCRRHGRPYPPLDDDGEIIGDFRDDAQGDRGG